MYNMIQKNREDGKKGFTLAELLVVVAIIAVLVAISIPIFTSQLNKAKESTDLANARAAKGAAVTMYLSDQESGSVVYNYDAENGKLYLNTTPTTGESVTQKAATDITAYGKESKYDGDIVQVTVGSNGNTVTTNWVKGK